MEKREYRGKLITGMYERENGYHVDVTEQNFDRLSNMLTDLAIGARIKVTYRRAEKKTDKDPDAFITFYSPEEMTEMRESFKAEKNGAKTGKQSIKSKQADRL